MVILGFISVLLSECKGDVDRGKGGGIAQGGVLDILFSNPNVDSYDSGAFSSQKARYFPEEMIETKNRANREWDFIHQVDRTMTQNEW